MKWASAIILAYALTSSALADPLADAAAICTAHSSGAKCAGLGLPCLRVTPRYDFGSDDLAANCDAILTKAAEAKAAADIAAKATTDGKTISDFAKTLK